jgi:uncharacterized protein
MFFSLLLFNLLPLCAQKVYKEQLTKKRFNYYDFEKKSLESEGCFYTDPLGETTEKHGKWSYYDRSGNLIETRNYYRNKLNGAVLTYYPNGKPKAEGYFLKDAQDSIYREWNTSNEMINEGQFDKGVMVGTWSEKYLSGRKKSIENHKDGKIYLTHFWYDDSLNTQGVINGNGECVLYYQSGLISKSYSYKNGLKNGRIYEYSATGKLEIDGKFENGMKDSTWNFYYYTGEIEQIVTYREDLKTGPFKVFYDKNRINIEGTYMDDKKTGVWTWYTNQGVIDQVGEFKNDQQHSKWTYNFPDGTVSYLAEYQDGLRAGVWTYYYKGGKLFKQGGFLKDNKNGKWETFYENGETLMSGNYVDGKEEGVWKNYWEDGELKNEATFKNGLLDGAWGSNYLNGKPKLVGEYKDGMQSGEWTEYFENGKPAEIVSYKVVTKKSKIDYGPMKDFETKESVKDGKWQSFSQKDFKRTEEGEYKNGEKTGVWYQYWPGGKMPSNGSTYKNGKLEGLSTTWDRKGNLVSNCEYKNGLKHGKMEVFDRKGKVIKELKFEYGEQIIEGKSNGSFTPK